MSQNQSKIKQKTNKCYESWIKYKESMKPFGKCGNCAYRDKCDVSTDSNARVIECIYQRKFKELEKGDVGLGVSGKSQNRHKKC